MIIEPRLISKATAAAYLGVTAATFAKWGAAGLVPGPLPGTRRWDRRALDLAIDKLSGIAVHRPLLDADEMTLAEWKSQNETRKAAARFGNRE